MARNLQIRASDNFQCRGQHAPLLQQDDGRAGCVVASRAVRLRLRRRADHAADRQAEHVGNVGRRRDVG
ncbi:hypothetical protein DN570_31000, partial [Burkholderia multivorans]